MRGAICVEVDIVYGDMHMLAERIERVAAGESKKIIAKSPNCVSNLSRDSCCRHTA